MTNKVAGSLLPMWAGPKHPQEPRGGECMLKWVAPDHILMCVSTKERNKLATLVDYGIDQTSILRKIEKMSPF